jgi:fumarate reductase flavoprotein subunit
MVSERTVDLVVVGSAASGLSCAVKAKQLGVERVLVLEKMSVTGGCSKFAGGIMAFGSPVQERLGLHYSVDDAFRRVIQLLNWNVDAKLVRKWITGTGENIRWLEELGVKFETAVAFNDRPDINPRSYHQVAKEPGSPKFAGYRIMEALTNNCQKLGIEILTKTRATHLIQEDGKIVGVEAEGPDGTLRVRADSVVLATGSISGNKELIQRFYHSEGYENVAIMANMPHNTGDGIIMAEEVGGAAGRINTLFIGPHNHFKGASEVVGAVTRRPYGIKVNKLGERFVDESLCSESEFGWMQSVNLDRQPGKIGYTIVDRGTVDYMKEHRKEQVHLVDFGAVNANEIVTFGQTEAPVSKDDPTAWILYFDKGLENEVAAGRAAVCDTVEEAAAHIGCPPQVLAKTIQDYNKACELGYDEEFLKDPKYLYPLNQGPYYVLDGPSGIDTCIGGLSIDNHQRVVDHSGKPLDGLYAVGVLTSNWLNGVYAFFGSEMSYSVFSGRNAAEEIAAGLKDG